MNSIAVWCQRQGPRTLLWREMVLVLSWRDGVLSYVDDNDRADPRGVGVHGCCRGGTGWDQYIADRRRMPPSPAPLDQYGPTPLPHSVIHPLFALLMLISLKSRHKPE